MSAASRPAAFHAGKLAVQAREGVVREAARIGAGFGATLPPIARHFLSRQRLLVVAGAAPGTPEVWATLLTGAPGFVDTLDERTLHVRASPHEADPLAAALRTDAVPVGVLALDLETRRRMKVKGRVEPWPEGVFLVHAERVFSLCPKYIQARCASAASEAPALVRRAAALSPEQRRFIDGADTFFIATSTPEGGRDASHRGGLPGFVRTLADDRLEFADYAGNDLFNTLGNLELRPEAGLLFVDFERGATLQLTGAARATWEPERLARFAGARRVVEFTVREAVEIAPATALRWTLVERSPFNPA